MEGRALERRRRPVRSRALRHRRRCRRRRRLHPTHRRGGSAARLAPLPSAHDAVVVVTLGVAGRWRAQLGCALSSPSESTLRADTCSHAGIGVALGAAADGEASSHAGGGAAADGETSSHAGVGAACSSTTSEPEPLLPPCGHGGPFCRRHALHAAAARRSPPPSPLLLPLPPPDRAQTEEPPRRAPPPMSRPRH